MLPPSLTLSSKRSGLHLAASPKPEAVGGQLHAFQEAIAPRPHPGFSRLPDRPGCSLMYRCQAAVGYSLLTSAPLCLWNPPIQMVWAAIWGQHIKDGWTHLQPALLSCDAVGPLRWFACRVSCTGSCTGEYQTLWMCSGWILSDDFTVLESDICLYITRMELPVKHWDAFGKPWP